MKFDTRVNILQLQDCDCYRPVTMKLRSDSRAQNSPSSAHHRPSGGTTMETVLGFPVNANQFNVLETNQVADYQCPKEEEEMGLVDPRTTRHLRRAASRAEVRG